MRLKLFGMFVILFLSYNQLVLAEETESKEWIVYFSSVQAAAQYQLFHSEQVEDQFENILKVKLTDIEKDTLVEQHQIERIEPNYPKSVVGQPIINDPHFIQQWGLGAIGFDSYYQKFSYISENEFLGKTFSVHGKEYVYQGQPLTEDTISIKLSSTRLSRISIEVDHVEAIWTLSIFNESGQLIGSNEGSLPKLDVLIPGDTYDQLKIVLTMGSGRSTPPVITNMVGVNHSVIAVIDSGVEQHEDFCGNILYSLSKDFKEGLPYALDTNGHGTHVTGILAACSNNQIGISGVIGNAPIDILPLKVLDHRGFGGDFEISKAIQTAIEYKVDIINMSLAGKGETLVLRQAVQDALNQNIPIVAAAGNWNMSTERIFPASYPGVTTVSGITEQMDKAPSSDFGWEVDIGAPGYNIFSTYLKNQYKYLNGTSMATPYITGALALIKLQFPDLDVIRIREQLFKSSKDILDKGYDQYSGYGFLNLDKALNESNHLSGIEWLSFKEGQPINIEKQQTIGFSPKWKGKKATIYANDARIKEITINNVIETVDFSNLPLKNNSLHLITLITDEQKKILDMNQIHIKTLKNQDPSFSDVPSSYWAYKDIIFASKQGLVNGFQDGTFKPNAHISRKHSVLMLDRLFRWDQLGTYQSPFLDIESRLDTTNLAIFSAYENGVIKGNRQQLFYPEKPLTRGQMTLILGRALHITNQGGTKEFSFRDIRASDECYYAVQKLTELGIIKDQDYFKPNDYITRGQFTAMIVRTLNYLDNN